MFFLLFKILPALHCNLFFQPKNQPLKKGFSLRSGLELQGSLFSTDNFALKQIMLDKLSSFVLKKVTTAQVIMF